MVQRNILFRGLLERNGSSCAKRIDIKKAAVKLFNAAFLKLGLITVRQQAMWAHGHEQ
jgi:hypothetical protein